MSEDKKTTTAKKADAKVVSVPGNNIIAKDEAQAASYLIRRIRTELTEAGAHARPPDQIAVAWLDSMVSIIMPDGLSDD